MVKLNRTYRKKDNMNMDPTIMGGLINPDIKQEGKTRNWKVVYFSEGFRFQN